jgi:Tol biopolymer transport system component
MVPGDSNGPFQAYIHDRKTGRNERINVGPGGVQPDTFFSLVIDIAANGRFVSFVSSATNLVPGGTNGEAHVFVRDCKTGKNQLVSVGPGGVQGNGFSSGGEMSADGRFVAFNSEATNLIPPVPGDTNGQSDTFVHDRLTGETRRVSVGPSGLEATGGGSVTQGLTADGLAAVFSSEASNLVPGDTSGFPDVFVRDRKTGTTERVSVKGAGVQGDGASEFFPAISPDGRFVSFVSRASNLVPGDTNFARDVFLRDRSTNATRRISVARDGGPTDADSSFDESPPVAADGRVVAFSSQATNLVAHDTNGQSDVFVRVLRR